MATAVAQVAAPQAADAGPRVEVFRRADGVELLGEFADSGFKKPPLLARRADGQVIQLTKPLYAVAALADGRRDANALAEILTRASNRRFTGAHVAALADKLRPVGVLALEDGTTPPLRKREPVMALRHRTPLLPERAVNILVCPFVWLHWPLVRGLVVL